MTRADDYAIHDYNRTHRHLSGCFGKVCLSEREIHEGGIYRKIRRLVALTQRIATPNQAPW